MGEFNSWRSYREFATSLRRHNRYFRSPEIEQFLETVLETGQERIVLVSPDQILWRSQLGHGWRPFKQAGEYIDDVPCPFPPNRMKPLRDRASEGRANPKGIPYLYLATDKETAMSEVRPWLGSLISLAQFLTLEELQLINCSVTHDSWHLYLNEPSSDKREQAVWADIDRAFSRPVTPNDQVADYVPTQVIAEFFKSHDFDGIVYKSALGEGHNIALFDVDVAELMKCSLFKVKSLRFEFEEAANPYYMKEYYEQVEEDSN